MPKKNDLSPFNPSQQLLSASCNSDQELVELWLREPTHDKTAELYRTYAERLLLWCRLNSLTFAGLNREHVLSFREFLSQPPPALISKTVYPRTDSRWRPFRGPLSYSSVRQTLSAVSNLFNYMKDCGHLTQNPFALTKLPPNKKNNRLERFLPADVMSILLDALDAFPEKNRTDVEHKVRCIWIVRLFYETGIRIAEAASTTMGGFHQINRAGESLWWLTVTGKGGKVRDIPVTPSLLDELQTYRSFFDLSSLPLPDDQTPLILSLKGTKGITKNALHKIIKALFEHVAKGITDTHQQQVFLTASAHWFRHTAGTRWADDGVDLRYISENLGHASLDTTGIYLHTDDISRHKATTKKDYQ